MAMAGTSGSSSTSVTADKEKKTPEQAVAAYNALRLEQRQIASKIYELESDLSEHRLVIDNLKKVDADRKCFRLIGGILTENTVQGVLPSLEKNSEQLKELIENLNQKLIAKGKEAIEGQVGAGQPTSAS